MQLRIAPGFLIRGILFIAACALLYYSSIMLLFVPSTPQEGYFARNRVLYGVVPFLLSSVLLVVVGRLSAKFSTSGNAGRSIANTFAYAITAVVLFDIGGLIVASLVSK